MGVPPLDEKAIFLAACRIESVEARGRYLEEACGSDAALLERVRDLLRVHHEEPRFLEPGPPPLVPTTAPNPDLGASEQPGTMIGRSTSFSKRSAKAGWAWSTWPSNGNPFAARLL